MTVCSSKGEGITCTAVLTSWCQHARQHLQCQNHPKLLRRVAKQKAGRRTGHTNRAMRAEKIRLVVFDGFPVIMVLVNLFLDN